jgi:hypothetical protein
MSRTKTMVVRLVPVLVVTALAMRAVHVHSVGFAPEIYRVAAVNNDLDLVEGLAAPGSLVELWYTQRNFKEGASSGGDRFSWCGWKNGGEPVRLGVTWTNPQGVWRFANLRAQNTVMLFPGDPGGDSCHGGIMTQLLPRTCVTQGVGCSAWNPPTVRWLNVKKQASNIATAAGAIDDAHQAALAVADGPNDGPEPSSVYDVDQNGLDTTLPGFEPGQRVSWKCGAGGTAVCPSVAVHDATTVIEPDPEFPFILGSMQGHRPGGSVFAAAAINRAEPLGFTVNVSLRFRGLLDLNLGCDQRSFFDFQVPLEGP